MYLLKRARATLATDTGTFNLTSIIVGALLVIALIGGLVAGLSRTLPWGQDMNAKEDLAAIRTAEAISREKDSGFKDGAGLSAAGWIDLHDRSAVGAGADGTCYVAIVGSRSGKYFFTTDTNTSPQILEASTVTGCLDPDVDDDMRTSIGAPLPSFGPLTNGGFERGLNNWEAGTLTGGAKPVAVSAVIDSSQSLRMVVGGYIKQGLRVPGGSPRLLFKAYAETTNPALAFNVDVYDRAGNHLATLPAVNNSGTMSVDLSRYANKDVFLRISVPASGSRSLIDTVRVGSTAPRP